MKAIVHIIVDHDLSVLKFDVDLDSLPEIFLNGYEVVVNFQAHDFNNQGVFYTDSNGLKMQKRILNERSYFNLTEYTEDYHNITSNYYPITSAISIRDGEQLFTIMNDKSQGGSSLDPGRIELMQNRRIPCDDNKGV